MAGGATSPLGLVFSLLRASVYPSCVIARVLRMHTQGPEVVGVCVWGGKAPCCQGHLAGPVWALMASFPGPQAPSWLPAHARWLTSEEGLGLQTQATLYQPGCAKFGPGSQSERTEEPAAFGEQ